MTWPELEMDAESEPVVEQVDATGVSDGCPVLLLSVESAARKIGVRRTTMYHLVSTGAVESVRVGRLRRVPVACLLEYVDRLRLEARTASR